MKNKNRCHHIPPCCCHCQSDDGKQDMDVTKTRRRIEDALRKDADPELLAKIAGFLGAEVAYMGLPEMGIYKYARPCHGPDQVRCACQIKKELTYRDVHDGVYGSPMKIIKAPFQEPDGSWWFEAEVSYGAGTHTRTTSLVDMSIVPKHGRWNAWNWLAFTDDSRHLAILHCRAYGDCCHNSHHHCCGAH